MKTEYKLFTIEEDYRNPYSNVPEFMFYLTSEGVQHDADCMDGESFTYTGNCKWASTLEEAKMEIDELNLNSETQNLSENEPHNQTA